jgi:hypothetical protein
VLAWREALLQGMEDIEPLRGGIRPPDGGEQDRRHHTDAADPHDDSQNMQNAGKNDVGHNRIPACRALAELPG